MGPVREGTHTGLGYSADPDVRTYPYAGHLAVNRVKFPSQMIAIADSMADGRSDLVIQPGPDYKTFAWPGKVHNRGSNVLFCDGHVEWYLQRDLTWEVSEWPDPRTIPIRRMWNNDHRVHGPGAPWGEMD